MAVREIAVSTENLGRDIARLRTVLNNLRKNKDKMVQEIEQLNTMWKGPANQMFAKQFALDCRSFDNLCRTIEEMIKAMENAKTEYEKCDNKVNALVNAIRI